MKALFIACFSVISFNAFAQKIEVDVSNPKGISVCQHGRKFCKYLYIWDKNSQCPQEAFYIPFSSCVNKEVSDKKRPHFNFKTEEPIVKLLLDTAQAHRTLNLCVFQMNISMYDDLYSKYIDLIAASDKWNEYLKDDPTKGGTPDLIAKYRSQIVEAVLRKNNYFDFMQQLLYPYGFNLGSFHVNYDSVDLVPAEELKRLKKDPSLIIPKPGVIWLQLSKYRHSDG